MARGVNKVIIIGSLGNDPETRYLPSGGAVTNISVATSRSWKDKNGVQQEETQWHRIIFFNRLAEIAGQYLSKGSKIFVEGSLKTSKWKDKDGNDRYSTDIIANEMQMLDSKNSSGEAGAASNGSQSSPQQSPTITSVGNTGFDDEDDGPPF